MSIKRYYCLFFVEVFLGLLVAVIVGTFVAHFLATYQFGWLSVGKKTPWWDFSWIKQKSPWGFFISFFIGSAFATALIQILWTLLQWTVTLFISERMARYEKSENPSYGTFGKGLNVIFHPFRRIACLFSKMDDSSYLPSIAIFEQKQRFLSENDRTLVSLPWKVLKFFIVIALLGAWFLSLFVFYGYATTIVNGQSAVNNLWIYFLSSFRIFTHTLLATLVIIMLGLVANRFSRFYLLHLDNMVYDEVLSRLDSENKDFKEIKEILASLNDKISRLEQAVGNLIRISLSNR
ncbi:MAG: hypothetical protein N2260_04260 [Syntrophobacterales bacterium]|nr:hypothetical protein [Syntrophobacterales bacterium]